MNAARRRALRWLTCVLLAGSIGGVATATAQTSVGIGANPMLVPVGTAVTLPFEINAAGPPACVAESTCAITAVSTYIRITGTNGFDTGGDWIEWESSVSG